MFDGDDIILSLANLMYVGEGKITDPETSISDRIQIKADLEDVQLVMRMALSTESSYIYPKIDM